VRTEVLINTRDRSQVCALSDIATRGARADEYGQKHRKREAVRDESSDPVVTQVSRAGDPDERLLSDAEIVELSLRDPASFAALFDRA
jgi:hypothetical protein